MNNENGAESEKLAKEIVKEFWTDIQPNRSNEDFFMIERVKQALEESYASGRAEVLAEVVPVIEFYSEPTNWTNADDKSYKFTQVGESDWNKSVAHGFVGGMRARELLQKLKGEK